MRRPSRSDTPRAPLRAPACLGVLTALLVLLLAPRGRADISRKAPPDPGRVWSCPVRDGASISQGNGGEISHTSKGSFYAFDYNVAEGTPIVAAREGVVIEAVGHNTLGGPGKEYARFTNRVVIRHEDGLRSFYSHLAPDGALVRVGEPVLRGEQIGLSGNTGWSTGPHLHFVVVDGTGTSIPVRFRDFDRNDGVPRKGDHHDKAHKPAISQKEIDKARVLSRSVKTAEQRGWNGAALLLLAEHKPKRKDREYAGHQQLGQARERILARMLAHADDTSARTPDSLFLLVRYELAAKRAKAPKEVQDALTRALRALESEETKLARGLRTPAMRLMGAMVDDCRGDDGAIKEYARILRAGPEPVVRLAQQRFDELVQVAIRRYDEEIARLKADARVARAEYERAHLAHAEGTLAYHKKLLKRVAKIDGAHRDAVKDRLKNLRTDVKEIGRLLDS